MCWVETLGFRVFVEFRALQGAKQELRVQAKAIVDASIGTILNAKP